MYDPTFMVYIHVNKYLDLICSIYNLELSNFPHFTNIIML